MNPPVTVDLDDVARTLEERRHEWEHLGFEVGPLTWAAENLLGSPKNLTRAECERPHSVGCVYSRRLPGRGREVVRVVVTRGSIEVHMSGLPPCDECGTRWLRREDEVAQVLDGALRQVRKAGLGTISNVLDIPPGGDPIPSMSPMSDDQRLLACLDTLIETLMNDSVAQGSTMTPPASYADWFVRMRTTIRDDPGDEERAAARRRLHAALVCGADHTPLERALTRYRQWPDREELLVEIAALTGIDPMYACPCCSCLTLPERPPGSWCRCPVCGWEDDGVEDGGGPNPPLVTARTTFLNRGSDVPKHLRDPFPEEQPH